MPFSNAAERCFSERKKQREFKLAEWKGMQAFRDGNFDNPYKLNTDNMLAHESILRARWLLGFFRGQEREQSGI